MTDVVFHPAARAEYESALEWYQSRNARAATRFEAEMERILEWIGTSPEMFPKYDDESRFAVLRRYPYSVIYSIQPGQVYVIAVAHSSRSAGYWQGRGTPGS